MTLAGLGLEIGAGIGCAPAVLLPYAGELSFAMVALTQASIAASGHYGYFNLLSAVLGLSLLSDQSPLLRPLAPAASSATFTAAASFSASSAASSASAPASSAPASASACVSALESAAASEPAHCQDVQGVGAPSETPAVRGDPALLSTRPCGGL